MTKTDLVELVERVHKFDESKIIVDFKNGYSVAYEKKNEILAKSLHKDEFICDAAVVLPQILPTYGNIDDLEQLRECALSIAKLNAFSSEFWTVIKDYKTQSFQHYGELDARRKQLYIKMIASLNVKTFKSRYWGPTIALKCFPLLVFAGVFLGGVPCIESLSAASRTQDFYRIRNKSLLKKKCDETSPAIYDDGVFNSCGKMDIRPNKIPVASGISFLFPPHIENDYFISMSPIFGTELIDQNEKMFDGQSLYGLHAKWYQESRYYLSVDESFRKELYAVVYKKDMLLKDWRKFKESLNLENQTALLKNIGFI